MCVRVAIQLWHSFVKIKDRENKCVADFSIGHLLLEESHRERRRRKGGRGGCFDYWASCISHLLPTNRIPSKRPHFFGVFGGMITDKRELDSVLKLHRAEETEHWKLLLSSTNCTKEYVNITISFSRLQKRCCNFPPHGPRRLHSSAQQALQQHHITALIFKL